MEMLICLVCLAWELQPDAADIVWPVFTRSQRRKSPGHIPACSPRGPGRWFHTILRFEGKYSVRSGFPLIFSSRPQLLEFIIVSLQHSPSEQLALPSICHGEKILHETGQTVMEDPCLGPVESAEKKGRSRIYPHGTHSLRGKYNFCSCRLLNMPPSSSLLFPFLAYAIRVPLSFSRLVILSHWALGSSSASFSQSILHTSLKWSS